MKWLYLALTFLVGYLVGSVNLSLVVTKYIGKIDIYKVGSGNAGGTNVARSMGWGWLTGIIAVMCASVWIRHAGNIKRILTGTERKISLGKKKKQ